MSNIFYMVASILRHGGCRDRAWDPATRLDLHILGYPPTVGSCPGLFDPGPIKKTPDGEAVPGEVIMKVQSR